MLPEHRAAVDTSTDMAAGRLTHWATRAAPSVEI